MVHPVIASESGIALPCLRQGLFPCRELELHGNCPTRQTSLGGIAGCPMLRIAGSIALSCARSTTRVHPTLSTPL